ncbi:hypothetical protein B0H14DRAFT_3523829 [Mycena olivaceomarginata]|nr:hypothetical protein B0H14DRAFT_3523829 [Mycena olivaceomarginata]
MRMLAIHIHRGDLKKLYNGKNKIPMQIFHNPYFDFKGDVLEILEQHHDWAKFTFTQELFRYVFMDFIPELIVHSKNQDEEQSAITMSSTHGMFLELRVIYTSGVVLSPHTFESLETLQDNKLAIICNKLDLKPTDRFPPTRSVSCAAITVKTRCHIALIASVMSKSDPKVFIAPAHRA